MHNILLELYAPDKNGSFNIACDNHHLDDLWQSLHYHTQTTTFLY